MTNSPRRIPLRYAVRAAAASVLMLSSLLPAMADGERTFPVGPGDLLEIAVFGEENVSRALSGRFRIEKDGTLYYPMLGGIDVSEMNATEIAELLREKLEAQLPVSFTSVTIAEFAPVFLTGEAASTGPFRFQPDMTVFDLVLAAGGLAGASMSAEARARHVEDVAALELTRFSLDVRKARLLAELHDTDFDTGAFAGPAPAGAQIVAAEAAIFEARKRALAARKSTYEAQKSGYEQEITTLEKSIALHDEEVKLIEEQLKARATLAERGFAAASTLSELKRQLASARRDALEFRTALFRARQNRLAADRDFTERKIEQDTGNVEQLREVELALGQNDIALNAARVRLAQFRARESAASNALGRVPDYLLIRRSGDTFETTSADETTPLRRGDVVRVSFPVASAPAAAKPDVNLTD